MGQLGHRNSNVTRAVYVQEVKNAERVARRRAKMQSRLEGVLAAERRPATVPTGGTVVDLRAAG